MLRLVFVFAAIGAFTTTADACNNAAASSCMTTQVAALPTGKGVDAICTWYTSIVTCASSNNCCTDTGIGAFLTQYNAMFASTLGGCAPACVASSSPSPSPSPSLPAPSPVPAPPVTTTIRHVVRILLDTITAASYTGTTKNAYEIAYAITLGLAEQLNGTYTGQFTSGATITSIFSGRRTGTISYTAVVPPALASLAQTNSATLTPTTLSAAIQTAATDLNVTVPIPSAAEMTTAIYTDNGSSNDNVLIGVTTGSVVLFLLVVAGVTYYFLSRNEEATEPTIDDKIYATMSEPAMPASTSDTMNARECC